MDEVAGSTYRLAMVNTGGSTEPERPLLLLIRTGRREFREYLLAPIARHYRVHMFLGVAPSWELEYVDGATVINNTLDTEAMVAAARELHARDPIAGVFTWDESRLPQTARIAAALGLPGGDVRAVARCRDKHLTRQALAEAGVPQPGSVMVGSVAEALATAESFGYPVIIKPSDLAVSEGVVKVRNPAELEVHFAQTAGIRLAELPDYRVRVLVEEYVSGSEISVDCAVHRGQVFPLCVAHKEIGFPPYCIELGHVVDGHDPLLSDPQLVKLLTEVHAALGFTDGVTHTEIMLTASGPKIIEVNGRLGGDLIPYLGLRATGIDTGLAAAAVALDRVPAVERDRALVAGIRFFHVDADDTLIESIHFDRDGLPEAIDQLVVLAAPGQRKSTPVRNPTSCRIAFATAVATTERECRAALAAAGRALVVRAGA